MIFSLIILVLIGTIAFFHYLQGFFSATISAILAALAATMAVAYHETVVAVLLKGKFADQANAMVLCAMFVGIYIILRLIVDKVVPGNIRLPLLVDKIGGGIMGLIAALFATGIVAIAAQSLPMGPTIAGYSRYALLDDQQITIPPGGTITVARDAFIYEQLKSDNLKDNEQHLFIPVDDFVLGTVALMSNGGSLAGEVSFKAVHPDYLQELFGQRIGVQVGGKRTAMNFGDEEQQVRVTNLYVLPSVAQSVADFKEVHPGWTVEKTLRPEPEQILLVVRTVIAKNAGDSDFIFRFSPSSVRLAAGGKNYYPVGTLENATTLYASRIDDPLFVDLTAADQAVDFVFAVALADVGAGNVIDAKKPVMADGVFLEVKRYGRVDLAGKAAEPTITASSAVAVMRKPAVTGIRPGAVTPATPSTPTAKADESVFAYESAAVSNKLFSVIGVNTNADTAISIPLPGDGMASLKAKQFETLTLDPKATLDKVKDGDSLISQLYVPAGKKMVQVQGAPSTKAGADPWAWAAKITQFEMVDTQGRQYRSVGAWAKVKQRGQDYMLARYVGDAGVMTAIARQEGRPTDIWIAFILPKEADTKELLLDKASLAPISAK